MAEYFHIQPDWSEEDRKGIEPAGFREKIENLVKAAYAAQEERHGAEVQRHLEKVILLQMVDTHWKDHLLSMDHLKEGIGLRGYGQKNPLNEYKREGYELFMKMIDTVKIQTVSTIMRVRVVQEDDVERMEEERRQRQEREMRLNKGAAGGGEAGHQQPQKRDGDKIGRNAPCPCGSGKKYKKCCGATQ
jgi:preprotein translocase subunit SecA